MTYAETIHYLYTATPLFQHQGAGAYKPGLQTTHTLDAHYGQPHRTFRTIHVAGTNGKGSCCHTLAAILQAAGLKVGLYTSPHLVDFRERIRVNGKRIPEQYVVDFVAQGRSFFEPLHPSFFEITTAMAFRYFADEQVDIAVIEVGLGGRLDCTNIITPLVSVITNISFDHTQFLGNTLAAIAGEKAGIIKHGVPAVVGETNAETAPVFEAAAKAADTSLVFADKEPEVRQTALSANGLRTYETRSFGTITGELTGDCQVKNANTILAAVKVLRQTPIGPYLTDDCVRQGFANVCEATGLMGRWQTLRENPHVVCDTGHNLGGWEYLSRQLAAVKASKLRIVFGMANDKDISHVLQLLPKEAAYYWAQASVARALKKEELVSIATAHGLSGKAFDNVPEAYHAALSDAAPDDTIFVGGSSFIVSDLLAMDEFRPKD